MRIRYLAYGSNMLPRRIEERLGRCPPLGVASVRGYSLRFHKRGRDGSGKCDAFLTEAREDVLFGVVYELTVTQRAALDEFEGAGYESRNVVVDTVSGALEVYTYVARAAHVEGGLRPFPWYKSIVVAGALVHDLPGAYVTRLRSVETTPDPDVERMSLHLALLGDDRW